MVHNSHPLFVPKEPRSLCRFVGLENQGATCYLNSLLQSLYFIPEFRSGLYAINPLELDSTLIEKDKNVIPPNDELVSQMLSMGFDDFVCRKCISKTSNQGIIEALEYFDKHHNDAGFFEQSTKKVRHLPLEMQKLFSRLQLVDEKSISTKDLTSNGFRWSEVDGSVQHDAHELNRLLLDAVERSLMGTSGEKLISALFQSRYENSVKCLHCENQSMRSEVCMDWNLPVETETRSPLNFSTSFHSSMASELLTGESQYFCSCCKSLQDAQKTLCWRELSPLMTFSCLRFQIDKSNWQRKKLVGRFQFPLMWGVQSLQKPDEKESVVDFNSYQALEFEDIYNKLSVTDVSNDSAVPSTIQFIKSINNCFRNSAGEYTCIDTSESMIWYQLHSVIVHDGSATSGHYSAFLLDCTQEGIWDKNTLQSDEGHSWLSSDEELARKLQQECDASLNLKETRPTNKPENQWQEVATTRNNKKKNKMDNKHDNPGHLNSSQDPVLSENKPPFSDILAVNQSSTSCQQSDFDQQKLLGSVFGNYYELNDSSVTPITLKHIMSAFDGDRSAYILVYRRIDNSSNSILGTVNAHSEKTIRGNASKIPKPPLVFEKEVEQYNDEIRAHRAQFQHDLAAGLITMPSTKRIVKIFCPNHLIFKDPFLWCVEDVDKLWSDEDKNISTGITSYFTRQEWKNELNCLWTPRQMGCPEDVSSCINLEVSPGSSWSDIEQQMNCISTFSAALGVDEDCLTVFSYLSNPEKCKPHNVDKWKLYLLECLSIGQHFIADSEILNTSTMMSPFDVLNESTYLLWNGSDFHGKAITASSRGVPLFVNAIQLTQKESSDCDTCDVLTNPLKIAVSSSVATWSELCHKIFDWFHMDSGMSVLWVRLKSKTLIRLWEGQFLASNATDLNLSEIKDMMKYSKQASSEPLDNTKNIEFWLERIPLDGQCGYLGKLYHYSLMGDIDLDISLPTWLLEHDIGDSLSLLNSLSTRLWTEEMIWPENNASSIFAFKVGSLTTISDVIMMAWNHLIKLFSLDSRYDKIDNKSYRLRSVGGNVLCDETEWLGSVLENSKEEKLKLVLEICEPLSDDNIEIFIDASDFLSSEFQLKQFRRFIVDKTRTLLEFKDDLGCLLFPQMYSRGWAREFSMICPYGLSLYGPSDKEISFSSFDRSNLNSSSSNGCVLQRLRCIDGSIDASSSSNDINQTNKVWFNASPQSSNGRINQCLPYEVDLEGNLLRFRDLNLFGRSVFRLEAGAPPRPTSIHFQISLWSPNTKELEVRQESVTNLSTSELLKLQSERDRSCLLSIGKLSIDGNASYSWFVNVVRYLVQVALRDQSLVSPPVFSVFEQLPSLDDFSYLLRYFPSSESCLLGRYLPCPFAMPLESQISKDKTPSSSKGSRSVKGGPTSSVIKTSSHSEIPLSVKLESLFDLSKLRNGCDIILEPYLPSKQGDVDSVVKILPTKEGRDSSMRVWFQHWTNPNVEGTPAILSPQWPPVYLDLSLDICISMSFLRRKISDSLNLSFADLEIMKYHGSSKEWKKWKKVESPQLDLRKGPYFLTHGDLLLIFVDSTKKPLGSSTEKPWKIVRYDDDIIKALDVAQNNGTTKLSTRLSTAPERADKKIPSAREDSKKPTKKKSQKQEVGLSFGGDFNYNGKD